MGTKTEALAAQIDTKARDAVATLEQLTDADWNKVTAAERWTIGVTAHHLAGGLDAVAGIVTGIVSGAPSRGNFTRAMLDEMNAQHAREHAGHTKPETIALIQKGAATASAVVRGLNDDQLEKRGTVFTDAPPMTAEQLIMLALLGHIEEHMASIRKTVGM
jgi:uncharacterized protein (TIGR03083 family)